MSRRSKPTTATAGELLPVENTGIPAAARDLVERLKAEDAVERAARADKLATIAELLDAFDAARLNWDATTGSSFEADPTYDVLVPQAEWDTLSLVSLEVGTALGVSPGSGWELCRDVVTLRSRLPRLWEAVTSARVAVHAARAAARVVGSRPELSAADDEVVDRELSVRLMWAVTAEKAEKYARAWVMSRLPDEAAEAARRSLKEQRVWWRRCRYTPTGIAELGAWLAMPQAVAVEAGISRVAAALARAGDSRDLEARRVTALAVLADPLRHLAVLAADPQPALDADVEVAAVRRLATISGCEVDCGFDDADREWFSDCAQTDSVGRIEYHKTATAPDELPDLGVVGAEMDADPEASHWAHASTGGTSDGDGGGVPVVAGDVVGKGCDAAWLPDALAGLSTLLRDPGRFAPTATVVVHVTADAVAAGGGVCRIEANQVTPTPDLLPLGALRDLLAGCRVTVRPVIDLNEVPHVDRYEIPDWLHRAVRWRTPTEAFPYSTRPAERPCDIDHTQPWRPGSTLTRLDNLAPLSRRVHRAKTMGAWRVLQPHSGVWEWMSPVGQRYLVGPLGTWTASPADPDPGWVRPGGNLAAILASADPPRRHKLPRKQAPSLYAWRDEPDDTPPPF